LDNFGYNPVFIAAGIIPLLAMLIVFVLLDKKQAENIASGKITSLFDK